jgi:hypothetical protein
VIRDLSNSALGWRLSDIEEFRRVQERPTDAGQTAFFRRDQTTLQFFFRGRSAEGCGDRLIEPLRINHPRIPSVRGRPGGRLTQDKELFIRASACNGVVVTPGAVFSRKGQDNQRRPAVVPFRN